MLVLPARRVRRGLRGRRARDFEGLGQLEVGLARNLEALVLPDEVLAVEVDAARVDAEELACCV